MASDAVLVECEQCGARFRVLSETAPDGLGHYCGVTVRDRELPDRAPAPVEVVE